MKKHFILAALIAALFMGSTSTALARGHDGGKRLEMAIKNLPQEKQAVAEKLLQEHRQVVMPLREQKKAAHLELEALSRNPNASQERIKQLAQEEAKLSTQLHEAKATFRAKMDKEVGPLDFPRDKKPGYKKGDFREKN